MSILVIAEHDNASLKPVTLNVVTAGSNCGAVAEAAAKIAGVNKVLVADNAVYEHQLAESMGELVAELGKGYSHVLAAATTTGKDFLPRAAALLDVNMVSEVIAIESADTFVRPIYAGNAVATVQASDSIKVLTVRGTGFDAAAAEGGSASVEAVDVVKENALSSFVGEELAKS